MKSDIGPFAIVPEWVAERASDGALRLWIALSRYANGEREAWPSVSTLAAKMDTSERTVQLRLRELESIGAVHPIPRKRQDGGQASTCYQLRYADPGEISCTGGGEISCTGGVKNLAPQYNESHLNDSREVDTSLSKADSWPPHRFWDGHEDQLLVLICEAVASVEKYRECNPFGMDRVKELADDIEASAPTFADSKAFLKDWRDFHKADVKAKYGKSDPIRSIRNRLAYFIPRWSSRAKATKSVGTTSQTMGDTFDALKLK